MEARTVLLGDWSRPVRDPIDLLRISYVAGVAVVWIARGDFPLNLAICGRPRRPITSSASS